MSRKVLLRSTPQLSVGSSATELNASGQTIGSFVLAMRVTVPKTLQEIDPAWSASVYESLAICRPGALSPNIDGNSFWDLTSTPAQVSPRSVGHDSGRIRERSSCSEVTGPERNAETIIITKTMTDATPCKTPTMAANCVITQSLSAVPQESCSHFSPRTTCSGALSAFIGTDRLAGAASQKITPISSPI
jgi:hypothetical protein